jgi:hypothetical protein
MFVRSSNHFQWEPPASQFRCRYQLLDPQLLVRGSWKGLFLVIVPVFLNQFNVSFRLGPSLKMSEDFC